MKIKSLFILTAASCIFAGCDARAPQAKRVKHKPVTHVKPVHDVNTKHKVVTYRVHQPDDTWLYYYLLYGNNNHYFYYTSPDIIPSSRYSSVSWTPSNTVPAAISDVKNVEPIGEEQIAEAEMGEQVETAIGEQMEFDFNAEVAAEEAAMGESMGETASESNSSSESSSSSDSSSSGGDSGSSGGDSGGGGGE